ncbi:unnamed protein product, partial [Symbiodinium microadriaticum]
VVGAGTALPGARPRRECRTARSLAPFGCQPCQVLLLGLVPRCAGHEDLLGAWRQLVLPEQPRWH